MIKVMVPIRNIIIGFRMYHAKDMCTRASLKYVKCPKKDSVIKVSLESDLLFSVEI